MGVGFRDLTVTKTEGNTGVDIVNVPGDGGVGPNIWVYTASAGGLPPSNPFISLQIFPGGAAASGTDSNGNIGISDTYVNSGNDKQFAAVIAGFNINMTNGFWKGNVRAVLNSVEDVPIDLNIQFGTLEGGDFSDDLVHNPPDSVNDTNVTYDKPKDKGEVDLTWHYNDDMFNPVSFVVKRNGQFIASVPFASGVSTYSFHDVVFNAGSSTYTYTIAAYKYSPDNLITLDANTVSVQFDTSSADINVTGSGGVTFGGAAPMVLVQDPSGLYTLSSSSRHDTIYDRPDASTVDVNIPDPFFKTGFIGG